MKTRQKVHVTYNEASEDILHFSLQGLLPDGHVFAFNTMLGMLSHLAYEQDQVHMLMEQSFTTAEVCVLLPLLEAYPSYCSHEVLVASFNHGRATEAFVERTRERLQEASLLGLWDQEMRPTRNVISRCRIKTRPFGLEISSILEKGYGLYGYVGSDTRNGHHLL